MSRVVVIGATGHIGSYLVPRLVRGGHDVTAMSRGLRGPYHESPEWKAVTTVTADRAALDAAGTFGERVAALRPDVVIDLVCFTAASAAQLVAALRPSRPLLVHCGTIWVHGPALRVPVTEDEPRTPYGEYGTGKAEIEALLHAETAAGGVPCVVLHPGHISGPGWPVITPAGNLDPGVWTSLATGRPLALPDHGLGVLNHVHADDVAQAFELALSRPAAIGASFHVVAEQAMTLRGLATGVAGWFGREPVLEFVDWPEFERRAGAEHAGATREHTFRSIAASTARAQAVLGYAPRYTSLAALHEALAWLVAGGQADIGGQRLPVTSDHEHAGPDTGAAPLIDTTVAHPARVYNYWLGGTVNYAADREAAERVLAVTPGLRFRVRANRDFLARTVRYLAAEAGIRQFLDIGTGIPAANNTHEVARAAAPDARIVYVDNDPIVLAHAAELLAGAPQGATQYIHGDARDPGAIVAAAARTLDFTRPAALLLLGVLHLISDAEDPYRVVAALLGALPAGSYLVISHPASDINAAAQAEAQKRYNERVATPQTLRGRAEVARFFAGLDLVPPGLVYVHTWRPEAAEDAPEDTASAWGGVARKPG